MSYKRALYNTKWDLCYSKENPWEVVCIDGDSMIFKYMIDYIKEDFIRNNIWNMIGVNLCSTKTLSKRLIEDIIKYSCGKLERDIKKITENGMKYVLVLGKGFIEEKRRTMDNYRKKREESYSEMETFKNIFDKNLEEKLVKSINKYVCSERDRIRDGVKKIIDISFEEHEEPDIYCPAHYKGIMSYDYDLFLFGAKDIIREIDEGKITFLSIDSLLEKLDLNEWEQLIKISILCGTDYNEGERNMTFAKAKIIVNSDPYSDLINKEALNFFIGRWL